MFILFHDIFLVKYKMNLSNKLNNLEVVTCRILKVIVTGVYSRPLLPSSVQKKHSFEEGSLVTSIFLGRISISHNCIRRAGEQSLRIHTFEPAHTDLGLEEL